MKPKQGRRDPSEKQADGVVPRDMCHLVEKHDAELVAAPFASLYWQEENGAEESPHDGNGDVGAFAEVHGTGYAKKPARGV
jgi:hypothetical protein